MDDPATPAQRPNLLGFSRPELEALCVEVGLEPYRGRQLYRGLFARRVTSFDGLTDLSKDVREQLAARFELTRPAIDQLETSRDGTRKYRFLGPDGGVFEAVYIPEVADTKKTNTLCVSSQTGCSLGCTFCFTASLTRHRNLATAEIIGQVLAVGEDVASLGDQARVTNVVFMGMGEPLLNYDAVVKAARTLIDSEGLDFSTRRVTISTAGIVPRIHDLGRDLDTQLAISLNATTDEVRDRIMPINRKWPLADLIAALRAFPLKPRRRITIEYVLLGGVNDSVADARRLVKLLDGIKVKVNLLPLNAHPRTDLQPPTPEAVERFAAELRARQVATFRRTPRGQDIAAACGQLGGEE